MKRITHFENECSFNYLDVDGFKVPLNHVWIEGDNKEISYDSRKHGPIPISLIKGKVILGLYPFCSIQNI